MAGRYINPFTPQTGIGQGLQNIASMLFNANVGQRDQAARDAMHTAHAQLYEEQARKARVERELAERLLADQGDDAQVELMAAAAGVPTYTVRGYRDALAGLTSMDPYNADPELSGKLQRAMLAVRPTYADKTISAENLAKAMELYGRMGDREAVMAGTADPTTTAQAYFATSGKAPYDDLGGGAGAINVLTGDTALNELGAARANQAQAAAGRHSAEAKRIIDGLFGPAVYIEGEDGTVTPDFLGRVAGKGLKARARPVEPRQSGPARVSPTDALNIQKLIAYRMGITPDDLEGHIDPAALGHITALAGRYAQETGNYAEAVERAIQETPLTEYEDGSWYNPFSWFASAKPRTFATPGQQPQQSAPAVQQPNMPAPRTRQEYDALPIGAKYIGTDGKVRVKGGA